MNSDFALADSYVPLGGGDLTNSAKELYYKTAEKWVASHYVGAFTLIIALFLIVLWLYWNREKFNPTQTMRANDSDQFGLGKEHLDVGRAGSYFAQSIQGPAQSAVKYDPNAAPGQPGSYAWAILHSNDYNCASRQAVGTNSWDWMNTQLHTAEGMDVGRANDNDLSKVLAGY